MVHALETSNQAERDIAIRRASGFNELYEAAIKKKAESASGERPDQQSGSRSGGNAKGKQRFGTEVEDLKQLTKRLVMQGAMASSKWTWGSDGHGNANPCGIAGTGTGTNFLPRDVPVPVSAGDGSVTVSVRGDVPTFSTLSKLTTTSPPPRIRWRGSRR